MLSGGVCFYSIFLLKLDFAANIDHAPTFPMHADEGSNATALAAIIRDMMFTCPQRRLSRALAASGYSVHSYRFAPPLHTLLGLLFGDYHCNALPFIFRRRMRQGARVVTWLLRHRSNS